MLRHLWIGIIVLGVVAGGCTSIKDSKTDGVELRVANRSDRDFETVDVTFMGNTLSAR